MAKKKSSGSSLAVRLQQIASDAQVSAQRLANEATEKSFKYNAEEAATARQWQTDMSNTAHQREVEDLKKAGLNPVLSSNQGAQSYTTSSASAQANDPSGAVSNLAATQMQGIASGYQADQSAAATRYAAKQSAAAMKAAAAAQASAARYAAAMQYQTTKDSWKWKTDYMKAEYKEKIKLPVGNFAGLIDKYAQRSGFADSTLSSKTVKNALKGYTSLVNDPGKAFKNTVSKVTGSNIWKSLNGSTQSKINSTLSQFGISRNATTRKLLASAIFLGSSGSWSSLMWYVPRAATRTVMSRLISPRTSAGTRHIR